MRKKIVKGCAHDGGGVKAIDQAVIMRYFERITGRRYASFFDRMAGTSAGSEIVCQAAYPLREISSEEILDNFRNLGPKVFRKELWRLSFAGTISSKYRIEVLASALRDIMPDSKLKESTVPLTIPAVDGNEDIDHYLKSDNEYGEWEMWAASTASSAAPYFFGGFTYNGIRMFDGGGSFNNPSRILMRDLAKWHEADDGNMFVLNLGCATGKFTPYPDGGVGWLARSFEFANRPASRSTAKFAKDDLGTNFIRLVVPHDVNIALDESSLKNIDAYVKETEKWISRNEEELNLIGSILIS